jgi:hypothetical protein
MRFFCSESHQNAEKLETNSHQNSHWECTGKATKYALNAADWKSDDVGLVSVLKAAVVGLYTADLTQYARWLFDGCFAQ